MSDKTHHHSALDFTVTQAIARLNDQLPLAERQRCLSPVLRALHQAVLRSFVDQGRPLTLDEIKQQFPSLSGWKSVQALAKQDLLVADVERQRVLGCYPMTLEPTPHRVKVNDFEFFAMCALDALSIAPLLQCRVEIESVCNISAKAVHISMQDEQLLSATPDSGLHIGVRWQPPCGTAAHSMCREMVFLHDRQAAQQWLQSSEIDASLFDLPQAISFGSGFFRPLL